MSLTEAKLSSLRDRHIADEKAVDLDTPTPKAVKKLKVVKLGGKKGKK